MQGIYLISIAVAVSGALFALLLGLQARSRTRSLEESRLYFASTAPSLEEVELSRPFGQRVVRPVLAAILNVLGRLAPQRNIEEIQRKLITAGRPNGWTIADFSGLRLLSALVCGSLAFSLLLLTDASALYRILLTTISLLLGFYLPLFWLNGRVRARQRAILRALPDGLDMLNICVGAGLGFNASLVRVGERWDTPLADEFNRVVTEMQLGKSRREALLGLAERTAVPEVESFVATLIQADQLGVSIAKVLRTQAEQMRILRRQRAEEMARQATIKMLFPLVFLIFPAMLAVLLGPAVPQILRTFTNLGR